MILVDLLLISGRSLRFKRGLPQICPVRVISSAGKSGHTYFMFKPEVQIVLLAAGLVCGCAGAQSNAIDQSSAAEQRPAAESPAQAGLQPDGSYVLSASELALNCHKLAGRTLVRILQIRDYELTRKGSLAARGLQKVVTPVFGGTERGADPDADYRRDRAMVEAYNRRLAEKGCKSFDLVKELQPKPAAESPKLEKR